MDRMKNIENNRYEVNEGIFKNKIGVNSTNNSQKTLDFGIYGS